MGTGLDSGIRYCNGIASVTNESDTETIPLTGWKIVGCWRHYECDCDSIPADFIISASADGMLSGQSLSEITTPPRCLVWEGGCSNTRHRRDTSLSRLVILAGLSRSVLRVRGRGWSVPVRPPCVPRIPAPGQMRGRSG